MAEKQPSYEEITERLQRCEEAVKAYMFTEQTKGGRNPHPIGTNKYRAFELGRAALAKPEAQEPKEGR